MTQVQHQFQYIEVIEAAIHNQIGSIEFYISGHLGRPSVHVFTNVKEQITVPAITIDDY